MDTVTTGKLTEDLEAAKAAAVAASQQHTDDSVSSARTAAADLVAGAAATAKRELDDLDAEVDAALSGLVERIEKEEHFSTTAEKELSDLQKKHADTAELLAAAAKCVDKGLALGSTGKCVTPFALCEATPRVDAGNKPVKKATLVYTGDPVPGVVGTFDCGKGYHSTTTAACMVSGAWSTLGAKCVACHKVEGGIPPECFPEVWDSCHQTFLFGQPSGYYTLHTLNGKEGDTYKAYCLNDDSLGWELEKNAKAKGFGGGWEIVHTLVGGTGTGPARILSNRALRKNAKLRHEKITPFDLKLSKAQARAPGTQMTDHWLKHSMVKGRQWMKFMTAINTGSGEQRKDTNLVEFDAKGRMKDLFPNQGWDIAIGGGWNCKSMPGRATVEVNGVIVGTTNIMVGHTNSIGFANRDNDPCSQPAANMIGCQASAGKHGFKRVDGSTCDNSIRHLVSYVDGANSKSASRCTYCCWGCGGWYELVMWGVRPTPSD